MTEGQREADAKKMEEHLDVVSRTLASMEGWEQDLENLLNEANSDFKDRIEELGGSIGSEVSRLSSLLRSLSRTMERTTPPPREMHHRSSSTLKPAFQSIPELKFVSWKEASSLESPAREHFTIEIPTSQPTPEDLNPSQDHPNKMIRRQPKMLSPDSDRHNAPETSEKPKEFKRVFQTDFSQPLEELPDRIRICSQRLAIFLDFNIHDSTLNRSSYERTPFTILRPFKFLVYKDEDIRRELVELERTRYERLPKSEEEYDGDLKPYLPVDDLPRDAVNVHEMPFVQLTALIKDLRCLVKFMDGYIKPTLQSNQLDHVYFTDLWYVFPAGSLIYMKDKQVPQKIWKVIQRTGGRRYMSKPTDTYSDREWFLRFHPFVIDCFHLDYDGTRYIQTYSRIQIDHFEGCQPIISLPALPIKAAEDAGLVDMRALVERGKEFVKCTRPRHMQYAGRNQILRPNGAKVHEKDADMPENATRYTEWIESEVMVDFERALQEMPGWRPGVDDLKLYNAGFDEKRDFEGIDNCSVWDGKISERVIEEELKKCQKWDKERSQPTEEKDLLLLPERVFGFVFRTRKWACLQIGTSNDGEEMLKQRKPRQEPWNDLQLPDGHKRLVQSLIESHSRDEGPNTLHFDLVRAKGKGVIILLHGVPGVGKTSTAECAAEANNKPLLPITCGDLGTRPKDVEKKLDEAFQLAKLWNCVLLLDEADIFLTQRSENDIHRNALVSVFLRVLEYYEGILFLTTNRVGVFDEAFKSRLHMALYYPPLKWKYTEKIWRTHLRKLHSSGLVDVDEDDIITYAETLFEGQDAKGSTIGPVWNGRQIRNAFQSAVALAGYNFEGGRIKVEREHFERVSKVSNEFNRYIWSIKSQSDADKAERWGFRFDQYRVDEPTHLKAMQSDATQRDAGVDFGQIPQAGIAQTGLPRINNPLYGFQQPGFPYNMAQPQGHFPMMPNTIPGGNQSHLSQTMQGQANQQLQQPYQQNNLQPFMNILGNQGAQSNASYQGQHAMNDGAQGVLGQHPASNGAQM